MDQAGFEITPLEPQVQTKEPFFRNGRLIKGLFTLAVVLAVAALAYFFFGRSPFSEAKVEFKIDAPSEVSSGEKVNYQIKYKNSNKEGLKKVKLTFFYPTDSVVIKSGKTSQFLTEDLTLNDIGPGEEGMTELPAYLVGDRGDIKTAKAILVYSTENVSSVFRKESSLATTISSLAVSLVLNAPSQAVSGQNLSYDLDYKNESSDDLTDLKLKFSYPDGFTITSFSPSPTSGKDTWEVASLKSGESGRITANGRIKGVERDSKLVSATLQKKIDGIFINYEKTSADTVLSTSPITAAITVNDQSSYLAQLGDSLDYQIRFTNNTETDLLGLTVTAKLEGTMFDIANLSTSGFLDSISKTISWNASANPLLNRLSPGQQGAVSFRVKLKNAFPSGSLGSKDLTLKVSAKIESPTVPSGFDVNSVISETSLVTRVASLPTISQTVFYSDPTFGNTGPIPPQTGKKTLYTVSWSIVNTSSSISGARARGVLPTGVNWEGQTRVNDQSSQPVFQSNSREVIWDLGALSAGGDKRQAWFQISLMPSSSQAGGEVTLVKNALLEGQDSFTKQDILVRVSDINTGDLTDLPNQGTVRE